MRIDSTANLGHYLRERRRRAGLSQSALAEKAGVSRRWLSDLEAGKSTIEAGLIFNVLAALEVTMTVTPTVDDGFDLNAYLDTFGGSS